MGEQEINEMKEDRTPGNITALEKAKSGNINTKNWDHCPGLRAHCSRSIISRNSLHRFLMSWNQQLYALVGPGPSVNQCNGAAWKMLGCGNISPCLRCYDNQCLSVVCTTSDHTVLGPSVSLLLKVNFLVSTYKSPTFLKVTTSS